MSKFIDAFYQGVWRGLLLSAVFLLILVLTRTVGVTCQQMTISPAPTVSLGQQVCTFGSLPQPEKVSE